MVDPGFSPCQELQTVQRDAILLTIRVTMAGETVACYPQEEISQNKSSATIPGKPVPPHQWVPIQSLV